MFGFTLVSNHSGVLSSDAARHSSSALNSTRTCVTSIRLIRASLPSRVAASCRPISFSSQDSRFTSLSFLICMDLISLKVVRASFEWVAPQCLGESILIRILEVNFLRQIFNNRTTNPNFKIMALCKVDKILHKTNIRILNWWLQIIMPFRIR